MGIAIVLALLTFPADDVDLDALFPGVSQGDADFRTGAPGIDGPDLISGGGESGSVLLVLALVPMLAAAPLVAPGRAYRWALLAVSVIIGTFVVLTILHLGLVFLPIEIVLLAALREDSRLRPSA